MKTYTGRDVDPLNLRIEDVDILDIAHHTANVARFNGATRFHYSSAQHAVYVSRQFQPSDWRYRLFGLLHDATDAYFPDVPTPIKHSPSFESFRQAETTALAIILTRFGLGTELPPEVKRADHAVMVSEGIELIHHRYDFAQPAHGLCICQMSPDSARDMFLAEFKSILSLPEFDGRT